MSDEFEELIMKITEEIETFYPRNQAEWRDWLEANHITKQSVWLIYYKKKTKIPSLVWSDAVDEAICFGWIDSKIKPIDDEKFMQFFSKRKPKSVWSKVNKAKVERLTAAGLMKEAGFKAIETAKQNGSWTILDEVEDDSIPIDLVNELKKIKGGMDYFQSLSKSNRKMYLHRIAVAKREETKQKRINETIEEISNYLSSQNS